MLWDKATSDPLRDISCGIEGLQKMGYGKNPDKIVLLLSPVNAHYLRLLLNLYQNIEEEDDTDIDGVFGVKPVVLTGLPDDIIYLIDTAEIIDNADAFVL